MSPVNYRLKLPTQWSIHDVFHIDLLTPYHETATHGLNYSRPPPDLVDKEEEYEVKKILDSWRFGKRCKLQYLIKWKGYPDLDNEWVNKDNVHANKVIREFKNRNPASETHISTGFTGESFTPLSSYTPPTHTSSLPMSDVNAYYLGTPRRIFAAELEEGLITETEVRELCTKKYIHSTTNDENALIAPLTPEELERIKIQFPDVAAAAMSAHAHSPMVQRLSDPDGMGATPTHQTETEDLDTELWTAKEGGEHALPVPFQLPGQATGHNEEGMLGVEGGAV